MYKMFRSAKPAGLIDIGQPLKRYPQNGLKMVLMIGCGMLFPKLKKKVVRYGGIAIANVRSWNRGEHASIEKQSLCYEVEASMEQVLSKQNEWGHKQRCEAQSPMATVKFHLGVTENNIQ